MADATLKMILLGQDRGASRTIRNVGDAADRAESKTSRMGSAFRSAGRVAAVGLAAGIGVAIPAAFKLTQGASDLAENQSKVGVVFGKSAGQILKASQTSATAMGLSKSAYLDAAGTLGNLLVSLDLAPKKAAGMSQEMVKLAGDMASFNNTSPEEALDALKSGLTGETEPLKRFGVNMNDATLKAQALKMGLIKSTKDALNPQTKALAAYGLVMKQTKTSQGDFARTSGGLANQQRILKAQLRDVGDQLGTKLLPIVTKMATWLNEKAIPAFRRFAGQMRSGKGAGGQFARIMGAVSQAVKAVGDWIKNSVVPWLTKLRAKMVQAAGGTRGMRKTMADLRPVFTVLKAVATLFFRVLLTAIPLLVRYWRLLATQIGNTMRAIRTLWNVARAAFRFLTSPRKISISIPGAASILRTLERIRSAASSVGGAVRRFGGGLPFFAGGTRNFAGGLAMVGERGPEIVNLPRGSGVHTAQESARMMNGRGAQVGNTYQITVNGALDPVAVGKQMEQIVLKLERKLGRKAFA